jgi:hypothetical protein
MSPDDRDRLARRHLRVGWWGLFVFVCLGTMLEALHGYKVGFYLDVGNETRRLLWRLAHAHGALLSLVNVVYGLTVRGSEAAANVSASRALMAGLVLVPLGFFAGGVTIHGGDPGLAVILVPAGAVAMAIGVAIVARRAG